MRDDRDGEAEEEEEEEEEGAGNCLVALARHHWARLPVSETGPARDQLLEVCLAAHERVRTSRGRRSVLSALRHVASSVDGELEWPGVVARLKQAFDASVKGWTSDKPVPAPLVDSVHAVYAVVRRYEFPNSEETIWDEAPDVLDDMVEKLVRPMVKRVLVAVMRDRGNGGARVPRAAWTQEKKKQAPESAAVAPAQVQATASSKSSGSGNEGKEATAAAAAGAGFSYVPPHLRNNRNNNKENDKTAAAAAGFHGVYPVDLARIVAKTFFRATRSYTPEGTDKIVADLIKVYPTSFMKEMLPNSLLSHGGAISPQAWRLHARMLKLLVSVQKNDECLEMVSRYHARVLDLLCRSVRVSSFGANSKKKGKGKGKGKGGRAAAAAAIQKNTLIPDTVLALCFDNIGIICDVSRPIWLSDMQPQLDSFLRQAVFPALALGPVDEQLWARDPDL